MWLISVISPARLLHLPRDGKLQTFIRKVRIQFFISKIIKITIWLYNYYLKANMKH